MVASVAEGLHFDWITLSDLSADGRDETFERLNVCGRFRSLENNVLMTVL
jgi:S-adenosylmethionine:tRNA-ribosyltransferase-isomerase (queuine synthetase)